MVSCRGELCGRIRERAQLKRMLASVLGGHGQVILLSGEPGVGKTRLAVAALNESGFKVYLGRAIERATAPYGPIAGALRDCLRQTGGTVDDCGPLGKYLGILLPELGPMAPDEADATLLVEAITSALAAKAKSEPTALLLDDLHWADESTVDLLPILAERLQSERIAIIGTYRDEDIGRGHPIRRLKGELLRLRMLRELPVEPLTVDETADVLETLLGGTISDGLRDMVFAHTQGLPLFIEEVAETLKAGEHIRQGARGLEPISDTQIPIPESIRDLVAMRLDGLTEEARAQLNMAAVIGDEFDIDLVRDLVGTDAGLNELMTARFITESRAGMAVFRHTLTRDAVLDELPWSERRDLHRKVAERLEGRGASPERLAIHWLAAGDSERARQSFHAAADRSCAVYAYRDAVRNFERALEIWPVEHEEEARSAALERHAQCAQTAGLLDEAVRAWERLAQSSAVRNDPRRRGETLRALATVHDLRGANLQSIEARDQSWRAFDEAGMCGEAAVELLAKTERFIINAQPSAASEVGLEALRFAERSERPELAARAKGTLAYAQAMLGQIDRARELAHDALNSALRLNSPNLIAEAYRQTAGVAEYSSDFGKASEAYTTARDYCREQGEGVHTNLCMGCMSYVFFRAGKWRQSLDLCREILRIPDGLPYPSGVAKGVKGMIQVFRGELKPAKKLVVESRREVHEVGGVLGELLALWSIALAHEHGGDSAEATEAYHQFIRMWERIEDYHEAIPGLCSAASFFAEQNAAAEVALCANALSSIATKSGNPEALAGLAFALGERALLEGDARASADHFLQAAAQFAPLEVPVEWARAEWRAGVALAAAGDSDGAATHLRDAYRRLRRLGARALSSQVARHLTELGEPVEARRNYRRIETVTLTKRQQDVARLLAEGLTNKEIAQRLFVSPRTVDMHVAHILDRLDCRSRTEAARKIADLDLEPASG